MKRVPGPAPATLAGVAIAFLVLPLLALTARIPWGRLGEIITSRVAVDALWVSVQVSLAATALCLVLGVPLAWVLARHDFPGRGLVRAVATLPMVLPPVVAGVVLLLVFGRRGLVGAPLEAAFGVTLAFTPAAAILAAAYVSLPFVVAAVEAGLASFDHRYEEVATTLGLGRVEVFRRVVVPLIAPSLAAGTGMAWARALGEFGATITFAGNVPGATQTLPLAVYLELEREPEVAYLLSGVLLVVSLVVMVTARRRVTG